MRLQRPMNPSALCARRGPVYCMPSIVGGFVQPYPMKRGGPHSSAVAIATVASVVSVVRIMSVIIQLPLTAMGTVCVTNCLIERDRIASATLDAFQRL